MSVETVPDGAVATQNTRSLSDTIATAVIRKYGLEHWLFDSNLYQGDVGRRFNQNNYRWVIGEISSAVQAAGLTVEQAVQEVSPTPVELNTIGTYEPYGLHARNLLEGTDTLEPSLVVLVLIVRKVEAA